MIEWLWDQFVVQRVERIIQTGRLQYNDVIAILSIVGTFMIATMQILRKSGAAPDVADKWEDDIRKTADLAKREGWIGVQHWHSRFRLGGKKTVVAKAPPGSNGSGLVFIAGAVALVALIAWLSR